MLFFIHVNRMFWGFVQLNLKTSQGGSGILNRHFTIFFVIFSKASSQIIKKIMSRLIDSEEKSLVGAPEKQTFINTFICKAELCHNQQCKSLSIACNSLH